MSTAMSMPVLIVGSGVGIVETRREEGRWKMSMAPEVRALAAARRIYFAFGLGARIGVKDVEVVMSVTVGVFMCSVAS